MKNPHKPEFLAEMKKRLHTDQKRLKRELSRIASAPKSGEYQANFPNYGRSDEDNATEIADHTAVAGTENILANQLKGIEAALQRLEEGAFGLTPDGDPIPEERLRANPAATTLVKK